MRTKNAADCRHLSPVDLQKTVGEILQKEKPKDVGNVLQERHRFCAEARRTMLIRTYWSQKSSK